MRGDPWGDGGGGGGGGAILIATSGTITVNGSVLSEGGLGSGSGAGSGGGIRFIASEIEGAGSVNTGGKNPYWSNGGDGVIRLDTYTSAFSGAISGLVTQGFQPIIIPAPNQAAQLAIASVAGVAVAASPSGALSNPDVVVPGQQANPVPIVVQCTNIALNTAITVNVTPMNGAPVSVTGFNTTGTLASSSATVFLNLPRGGGLIYAQATTGLLVGSTEPTPSAKLRAASYAQTGLTTSGERFTKIEITAALGGKQRIAYLTESGKRYTLQSAGL
jgi:hypothetical protein